MVREAITDALSRFQQSEYTGENRCLPCTLVNLGIAAIAAAVVAVITLPGAVLIFLASTAVIYLRGYLVPGTPTLTQRYLPERVLWRFGKETAHSRTEVGEGPNERSVEAVLKAADAVTECEDRDDLSLTTSFREAWFARIESQEADTATFARAIGLKPEEVTVDEAGHVFVSVSDLRKDQWGTRAAMVADTAAAVELRERVTAWDTLPLGTRHAILQGLRVFLEQCPSCGGPIAISQQEVASGCCGGSSRASVMASCDARIAARC